MRPTPCGCTSAFLSEFTGGAEFSMRLQLLLRRPSSSQTPHPSPRRKRQVSSVPLLVLSKLQTLRWFAIWFRLSCQKKWAKRGAGCGSDCTASHRMSPLKNIAASTRDSFYKVTLQRRLRGNNARIENRCRARRWQNTLLWNAARIYVCADSAQYSSSIVQYAVQYRNRPSIPEMSRTEIDAVCPQMRVVHLPEPKAIRMVTVLRPNRALNKNRARQRAI